MDPDPEFFPGSGSGTSLSLHYITLHYHLLGYVYDRKKQETNLYHIHNNTCQTDGRTYGRMN